MCVPFQVNDTIRVDISTNKIMDFIKFEAGNICMVTGGANTGRVGIIMNRERHQGSFDIVHVKVKKKCFHSLPYYEMDWKLEHGNAYESEGNFISHIFIRRGGRVVKALDC